MNNSLYLHWLLYLLCSLYSLIIFSIYVCIHIHYSSVENFHWQKLAETCLCRTGVNRFKPPSAETSQPWFTQQCPIAHPRSLCPAGIWSWHRKSAARNLALSITWYQKLTCWPCAERSPSPPILPQSFKSDSPCYNVTVQSTLLQSSLVLLSYRIAPNRKLTANSCSQQELSYQKHIPWYILMQCMVP